MFKSNMKSLVIFALLAPLVLCRVPYNVSTEPSIQQIKEIYELKSLTDRLTELNLPYKSPLESKELEEEDVSFYVYNREDKTGDQVLLEEAGTITEHSSFSTNLKTVFVVHGWHNTVDSPIDVLIEAALLGFEDVNIIAVDWDELAKALYPAAYASVPKVGEKVGEFITAISQGYGYSLGDITIIGHSLGAHIAGFAGKNLNGQIGAIIGLDPAGPLYFESLRDQRLCEDDAQYVMAIHTCAKLLGVNYRVGNADFWPNGGYNQAGCGVDLAGTCAHSRSYQYLVESATSSNFVARECDSYDNYEQENCKDNSKAVMGGADVDPTIFGSFYLDTNEDSPYAQGDTGL